MRTSGPYAEKRVGRKKRKAREKLAARIAGWEEIQKLSKSHHTAGYRKPGSLKCR